jgi:4-oxalocrotonate tautomerase
LPKIFKQKPAGQPWLRARKDHAMPFVNIRILEGHSQERKTEMTRRIVDAVSEIAELPKEAVWVVFEDVSADDWFVGDRSVRTIRSEKR